MEQPNQEVKFCWSVDLVISKVFFVCALYFFILTEYKQVKGKKILGLMLAIPVIYIKRYLLPVVPKTKQLE